MIPGIIPASVKPRNTRQIYSPVFDVTRPCSVSTRPHAMTRNGIQIRAPTRLIMRLAGISNTMYVGYKTDKAVAYWWGVMSREVMMPGSLILPSGRVSPRSIMDWETLVRSRKERRYSKRHKGNTCRSIFRHAFRSKLLYTAGSSCERKGTSSSCSFSGSNMSFAGIIFFPCPPLFYRSVLARRSVLRHLRELIMT